MTVESFQPAFDYINDFFSHVDGSLNCYPDKLVLIFKNLNGKNDVIEGTSIEEIISQYYDKN